MRRIVIVLIVISGPALLPGASRAGNSLNPPSAEANLRGEGSLKLILIFLDFDLTVERKYFPYKAPRNTKQLRENTNDPITFRLINDNARAQSRRME